jgi:hypothetical protein
MTNTTPKGFRSTFKTLAGGLIVSTALALSPAAFAQDAPAAPAADAAPAAAAPAAPTPPDPKTVIATVGGK